MTWDWLGWCTPIVVEPPRSELNKFCFKNGTTVWARDWDAALDRIWTVKTRDFWASETEPGTWEVQFEARDEPYIVVTVKGVESGYMAARHARWFLERDGREQKLKDF